mgnify:CR=1 FL=1
MNELNEKVKSESPFGPPINANAIVKSKLVDPIAYKFNEDMYVEELMEVIKNTYTGHYSREQFQATEFIIDGGHGAGFCIGNIMKYAQRYGKKGNTDDARKDIMKVLHYAIMMLHVHDIDQYDKFADIDTNREEYKYNTD